MRSQPSSLTRSIQHVTAVVRVDDFTGDSVDCAGWANVKAILHVGAVAGSAEMEVKLQESADESTWTDIPGAAFTKVEASNEETQRLLEIYKYDRKRYIRAVGTYTGDGETDTVLLGVNLELSFPPDLAEYATDSYDASV